MNSDVQRVVNERKSSVKKSEEADSDGMNRIFIT